MEKFEMPMIQVVNLSAAEDVIVTSGCVTADDCPRFGNS
jgi:hypothetical protein